MTTPAKGMQSGQGRGRLTQPVKRSFRVVQPGAAQQAATARANLRAAFIQATQAQAQTDAEYSPQQSGSELLLLSNTLQSMHAELHPGAARFLIDAATAAQAPSAGPASPHSASFALRRYGCDGDASGSQSAVSPAIRGSRVVYARGAVTEWYKNGPLGVEQGFDLAAPPSCRTPGSASGTTGQVALEMGLTSDLHPTLVKGSGGPSIEFRDEKGLPVLRYSDLFVSDADGQPVPAQMTVESGGTALSLLIDDRAARYPLHVDPLIWAQVGSAIKATTLTTSGPEAGDKFGAAIAISGDTAVVGAPFNNDADVAAGAAFIFTRSAPGQWMEQAELLVGVTASGNFGQAVAISDIGGGMKRVVIGAPGDNMTGSASFISGSGSTWNLESTQAPIPLGSGALFGTSVGVSNDRIIVGGPSFNSNDGYAAIYEPDSTLAGTWDEVATLLGPAGQAEQYGAAVSIDTNLALIGAPLSSAGAPAGGSVDIVLRNGGGVWSVTQTSSSSVMGGHFGTAVALSAATAVVGSPSASSNTGVALELDLNTTTGMVSGTNALNPNGLVAGDLYGSSVAIGGTLAVIGAPARNGSAGDAFVFELLAGTWTFDAPAISRKTPTAGELFGSGVAVDSASRVIVVGAPRNSITASQSGAFYEIIQRGANGTPCTKDADCASDFCIDAVCCNSDCGRGNGPFGSEPSTDCQACSLAAGGSSDGTCTAARAGLTCNNPVGQGCDRPALCRAGSTVCPPNPLMPASTVCRSANGPCDNNEYCDGLTPNCPADTKLPSTTVCRPAFGPCDLAEMCDGVNDFCPGDAKAPMTTQCRPAAGPCDVAETCDGSTNNCPADRVAPFGTVCHQAASECDLTEACDGNTINCPFDYMKVDGTTCTGGSCHAGLCRAEADLAITLTDTVANTLPVRFTATVTNNGPSTAMQIQLMFALNNGATIAQPLPPNCQAGAGVLNCALTDLNAGSSTTLVLMVLPQSGGQQFSVSSVVSSAIFDPLLANNTATAVAQGAPSQVLSGGGFSCSVTPRGGNQAAVAVLALALFGLLRRRRRVSP